MKTHLPLDEAEMLEEVLNRLKLEGKVIKYTITSTNREESDHELDEAVLSVQFKNIKGAFCFGQRYYDGRGELYKTDSFVENHYHRFGFDEKRHPN